MKISLIDKILHQGSYFLIIPLTTNLLLIFLSLFASLNFRVLLALERS